MQIQEAYQRAATAGRILQTGRYELARILLDEFEACRLGQTGTMTWVDCAAVDLVEAHLHADHEGVKNYYRVQLGYPIHRARCSCPPPRKVSSWFGHVGHVRERDPFCPVHARRRT